MNAGALSLVLLACNQPSAEGQGAELGRVHASTTRPPVASSAASISADHDSSEPTEHAASRCVHPRVESDCKDGFCRIPAGCFQLGAPRDEWGRGRYSDRPVRATITRPFWIGQTEVTYGEWEAEGFAPPQRDRLAGSADCRASRCPVSNVSLFDAMSFANRYSERRGLPPCYELSECQGRVGGGQSCRAASPESRYQCSGQDTALHCRAVFTTAANVHECTGYRLPTEAEWEYAARAGTTTPFFQGPIQEQEDVTRCTQEPHLENSAWYCNNSAARPQHVAQKQRNPWGLFDVLGNVSEWTTDLFDGAGYGEGALTDPLGRWVNGDERNLMPRDAIAQGIGFVARGGNHLTPPSLTKVNRRAFALHATYGATDVGFRLVRTEFD